MLYYKTVAMDYLTLTYNPSGTVLYLIKYIYIYTKEA